MNASTPQAAGPWPAPGRLGVLTVCTGNLCRSPVSERLLDHLLGDLVDPVSAGTAAVSGPGMHPAMSARLVAQGVPDQVTPRQLTAAMVRDADLVLTMTCRQRSQVLQLWPAKVRSTFTLPEFAAIVAGLPPLSRRDRQALVDQVAQAAAHRSLVAGKPGGLEIADPYGGPRDGYDRAFDDIQRSIRMLAEAWH